MQSITASFAKQNFGEALLLCAHGPVRIERHRKTVAGLVPVQLLAALEQHDERRAARLVQQQVEQERLVWHQRVAIELLCAPVAKRKNMVRLALSEVQRWHDQHLCSADYIDRWRAWLALDTCKLAQAMSGDAHGWGKAMRQNSPFRARVATSSGA